MRAVALLLSRRAAFPSADHEDSVNVAVVHQLDHTLQRVGLGADNRKQQITVRKIGEGIIAAGCVC